jgi:hypothetical protein
MNCLDCQAALQQRLDGGPSLRTADLDQHLARCVDCRELFAAARLLADGLQALPRPKPDDVLAARILSAALEDRRIGKRRVRLRMYVTTALAASILLLMFGGYLLPTRKQDEQPQVVKKNEVPKRSPKLEEAPPVLAERAENARQAVAQLTERVAGTTRDQAKMLLAMANPLELAPMAALPGLNDLEEPLDPAAKSLRAATQTMAEGIEPMARTARSAWNYLVKELPAFDVDPSN